MGKRGKPPTVPHCRVCGETDPFRFSGYNKRRCKPCLSKAALARYHADPERYKAKVKAHYLQNREKYVAYFRSYGEQARRAAGCLTAEQRVEQLKREKEHRQARRRCWRLMAQSLDRLLRLARLRQRREERMALVRSWEERRPVTSVVKKIRNSMRHRIREMIYGKTRTSSKLPFSSDELRQHLEKQFCKGMSWDNYGTHWHVDHITPLSAFDPSDEAAWCLTNLRPLPAEENLKKSHKVEFLI